MGDRMMLSVWLAGSLRQTVRYNGQQEVTFAKTDLAVS
jgi:hypothetical protein